jgi:hypothetical protein
MTKSRSVALTVLAVLALAACADEPSTSVAQGSRETWQDAGFDSYALTIERMCFCPDIGPYVVTVIDGEVASVTSQGKDVPLDDELLRTWPLTVEDLFAEVDDAQAHADDVAVRYDEELGYPTRIAIDRLENAIDDEMTYVVRSLDPA